MMGRVFSAIMVFNGLALAGDHMEYTAEKFVVEQCNAVCATFDIVYLRDLYRQISAIIGGGEQLNLFIRQRFLIVTPMASFSQGLTNDLLYSLASRDAETSKQIIQLVLEKTMEEEAL